MFDSPTFVYQLMQPSDEICLETPALRHKQLKTEKDASVMNLFQHT